MINKQDPFKPDDINGEQKVESPPSIKKEAKKSIIQKVKYWYDVRVECMLPATITYRILAEDPTQAAELIKGKSPNSVVHKLIGRKELVLRVYDASSSMMRLMKRLFVR